jgi:hypothetical protein
MIVKRERNKIHTRICENCGIEFKTSYIAQKNCSKQCSISIISKKTSKSNDIIIKKEYAELQLNSAKYGIFYTKIDNEDIEKIKDICWTVCFDKNYNGFYVSGREHKTGKCKRLHRVITNCPDRLVVDHINHDTLDNRKQNLKVCTNTENMQNIKSNASGIIGVSYHKSQKKYQASISYNRKRIYLGIFENIEDAITARKEAELIYFMH